MDEPERSMTPLQAAAAIRDVSAWSDELTRRIEGLTWMVWGIVTPAIFTTYAFAGSATPEFQPWFGLLWLPWAALGLLFTTVLWRSMRVVLKAPPVTPRELFLHAGVFLLATVGSVLVVLALDLPFSPPTAVLLGIGLVTAMLGVRDASGAAARGPGLVQALGGLLLIAFAVAEAVALGGRSFLDGIAQAALANAVASAVVLGGVGLSKLASD